MDTQTLLTIHKHVITRDKRIKGDEQQLAMEFVHINKVEEKKDKGFYMCQINTEPMVSQLGHLDVMEDSSNFRAPLPPQPNPQTLLPPLFLLGEPKSTGIFPQIRRNGLFFFNPDQPFRLIF
ncbi:ig domain-containing protein [Caerostris extrusa]|uniref:Ig domain-containing protein n=1 Tax=Caerostris extrusa TaxID=172846 RepID=A0AAV4XVN0_CAEEX|nr:ig domain-containing protein [Caerostris extrusa]